MEKKSPFRTALNELIGSQPEVDGEQKAAPVQEAAPEPAAPQFEVRDVDTGVPVTVQKVAPTVVNEGVTIDGSFSCDHDLLFAGTITGNLKCEGKLTVRGYVVGNIYASQLELNGARVRGNVVCHTGMMMSDTSMIVGNVETGSLGMWGKVKGDISVQDQANLHDGAYVLGDVTAGGIAIEQGACLNGRLSTRSDVNVSQMFSDLE